MKFYSRPSALYLIVLLGSFLIIINSAMCQRQMAQEAVLFKELRDGVFTIFGYQGHGSGFLIDSNGVILTNQHVIASSKNIRAQINDTLVVPAILLTSDESKDIAALQIHPTFAHQLPILKMRMDSTDFAFEGEKVFAIGSPLSQTRILTTGIVSKLEKEVIISDVNINPGNSGGPLINLEGEVIGICTFAEGASSGPGISGIIRIDNLKRFIDQAVSLIHEPKDIKLEELPTIPKDIYPLWALKHAGQKDKYDTKPYKFDKGNFRILIQSPPFQYWQDKLYEKRISKNRKRREEKANIDDASKFDPYSDLKEWYQYAGEYIPIVSISVIPKIGETSGSVFGNLLGAFAAGLTGSYYFGSHTYEFKADLQDVWCVIGNDTIPEIRRGMPLVPLDFYNYSFGSSYRGSDLACMGYFLFPYDLFSPVDGDWPAIKLIMQSLNKPHILDTLILPQKTIEQLWIDFEPYRDELKGKDIKLSISN